MAARKKSDAKPPYKENAGAPLKPPPPSRRDRIAPAKKGNVDSTTLLAMGANRRRAKEQAGMAPIKKTAPKRATAKPAAEKKRRRG